MATEMEDRPKLDEAPGGGEGRPGRNPAIPAAAFLACLLLSGAAAFLLRGHRTFAAAVEQPVAFNHRKHVTELELSCSTCHVFYEREAFSGLPDAEVCASCHSEAQGKSAEERRLVELLKSGRPLAWKGLFRQPAHVFYSHRRHVVGARIECRVCHGGIGESVRPPARGRPLAMSDCIGCHKRTGASTACTSCHR